MKDARPLSIAHAAVHDAPRFLRDITSCPRCHRGRSGRQDAGLRPGRSPSGCCTPGFQSRWREPVRTSIWRWSLYLVDHHELMRGPALFELQPELLECCVNRSCSRNIRTGVVLRTCARRRGRTVIRVFQNEIEPVAITRLVEDSYAAQRHAEHSDQIAECLTTCHPYAVWPDA